MESDDLGGAAALHWNDSGWPDSHGAVPHSGDRAAAAVGALYQVHGHRRLVAGALGVPWRG
jgi:hypothetical protein